tara:strand:- start:187 stop:615 length:429 start_codon:yes stop_codon:yes gene_type:complete
MNGSGETTQNPGERFNDIFYQSSKREAIFKADTYAEYIARRNKKPDTHTTYSENTNSDTDITYENYIKNRKENTQSTSLINKKEELAKEAWLSKRPVFSETKKTVPTQDNYYKPPIQKTKEELAKEAWLSKRATYRKKNFNV